MSFKYLNYEVWMATGSQHLYGPAVLQQVQANSQEIAATLTVASAMPLTIVYKKTLTTEQEIFQLIQEANCADRCVGLVVWMHTFSPAKMWIKGLRILQKPLLHFHTQFNSHIPWADINMDYMNLNQSAHGGREFGFICSRMGIKRKVVVGHWKDEQVQLKIGRWCRVACAWQDSQEMKVARFGDNMREVAVTEGNKVSAQIQFGYSVNGFGMGDLVENVEAVSDTEVRDLIQVYESAYILAKSLLSNGKNRGALHEAARIEIALRHFLTDRRCTAFTDTFENLHGLSQLPGLAVQRLMADGYGFGAEGDWKTAALVRTMKVMADGLPGGNSFMEDYTYHFDDQGGSVLGAHMLEICPSIAAHQPTCEIHPLGIGGKADPVRLVFTGRTGPALNASLIDLGDRFKLLLNPVDAIQPPAQMPNLPVARVMWRPRPTLEIAAEEWIKNGGAHHTCYSENLSVEMMQDFADMAGVECVVIGRKEDARY